MDTEKHGGKAATKRTTYCSSNPRTRRKIPSRSSGTLKLMRSPTFQPPSRYLDALASVDDSARAHFDPGTGCKAKVLGKGARFEDSILFCADDGALLEIISRGEFMIGALSNREVRERLFA